MSLALEPTPSEMRELIEKTAAYVLSFLGAQEDALAGGLPGAEALIPRFLAAPPDAGRDIDELLAQVNEGVARSVCTTGPGYLAYIPGGGLLGASLGDLVACTINRYVGMWQLAPALTALEESVLRWICKIFDFPQGSQGLFTSGGSMAMQGAIVAARQSLLGEDFFDGTLYLSDQAHASVAKAALLCGLPRRSLRAVPTDACLRMDLDALAAMVAADRLAGLRPFCVVASAGTTNIGAVDPLPGIVAFCREERLWLHVDAAYGGFFQLTARGKRALHGIEGADSITLDPHKGLFLPYGTGCLIVRDGQALRRAHYANADYLQDLQNSQEPLPSYSEYSPELSRDFRGLRVWFALHLHGVGAFTEALDEKLTLARFLYDRLHECPDLETPWEPDLSVVAFRCHPSRGDPESRTRELLRRINASGRVYLSSTRLGGRQTLRACILCQRTHRARVEEAARLILEHAAAV